MPPPETRRSARPWLLGAGAALAWALACVRWFDAGASLRPAWLQAVPPAPLLLAAAALALGAAWPLARPAPVSGEALAVILATAFRLPLVVQGAAGYLTADGALSGIVALHLRDGIERLVFVPQVPYSGSLKSHLTALLLGTIDPAPAFALVSVLFYAAFTAAVCRLAALRAPALALPAGLYVAFAPAFVTRYSLSNDGNYVEVLALGAWALAIALTAERAAEWRPRPWLWAGALLGLAFWCHLLAVIYVAALGLWLIARRPRQLPRLLPALALGFALGALPSLLWNAGNGGESFRYLLPGGTSVGDLETGPGWLARLKTIAVSQAPVLLGYDPGYGAASDWALWLLSLLALGAVLFATVRAGLTWRRERDPVLGLLLLLTAVNLALAVWALPALTGNPRYLLFLVAPLAVFLAEALAVGRRRALLALIVASGAMGSLAQAPGAVRADRQWRALASGLEAEGERYCYTDFFIATKLNFLSRERVICSAKLGPTTTEYFFDYRRRVDAAPEAALVAVNATQAEKLERRLQRLGVAYQRRDLMKPVLLHLSRKVDPAELFPDRDFPLR